jgi:hypothetical protein
LVEVSRFALAYQRRRDLALRATTWDQLFDPILPGIFLAWAKRNRLDVSPELEAAVAVHRTQVADWKTLYDKKTEAYDELQREFEDVCRTNRENTQMIESLANRVRELSEREQARENAPATSEKSLSTRERDSLLKLIIGMAVVGYGYDPTAARSEQPAEITSDLAAAGVPLDVDTVRKWLKQAVELLPPK